MATSTTTQVKHAWLRRLTTTDAKNPKFAVGVSILGERLGLGGDPAKSWESLALKWTSGSVAAAKAAANEVRSRIELDESEEILSRTAKPLELTKNTTGMLLAKTHPRRFLWLREMIQSKPFKGYKRDTQALKNTLELAGYECRVLAGERVVYKQGVMAEIMEMEVMSAKKAAFEKVDVHANDTRTTYRMPKTLWALLEKKCGESGKNFDELSREIATSAIVRKPWLEHEHYFGNGWGESETTVLIHAFIPNKINERIQRLAVQKKKLQAVVWFHLWMEWLNQAPAS
jgi:hypothetical protein